MPTFKLTVSPVALNLGQAVLSAVFSIKRASVVDSFVIVPDLKCGVVVVDNEDFEVNLLPNTPGSIYEVVLFGARTELMRAFFLMPANDVFLHELNLLTAYPVSSGGSGDGGGSSTFLGLSDTPNSYVGHAGKLVAVKQDETGLEFINSDDTPAPQISCEGATDSATLGKCTESGVLEYFINGISVGNSIGRLTYNGVFESKGLRVIPLLSDGSVNTNAPYYENTQYQRFENLTSETIRVKVKNKDADTIENELTPLNPTMVIVNESYKDNTAEFCLLPKQTECSLTEIILMLQQSWNGMDESGYEKSIKLYDATTNELLAFAEEPLEMDSEVDYPNLIPNFLINVNGSAHELHAEYFTDASYDKVLRIKSNSSACRKFRLEVFIGNEGMCVPKTVPSNPGDLVVTYPVDYDDFFVTPVKVYFCLCSDAPTQPTFLRLKPSKGNTIFTGEAEGLTLINSANEIVYRN